MRKIWSYKTRKYVKLYTLEGLTLEQEYAQVPYKDLVSYVSKASGYKLLNSFMKQRLNIPKNCNKITGAVINTIRDYNSKVLAYVYLFIQLCNSRKMKGLCPAQPSEKIYIVKGFYQNYVRFFDNDNLVEIPYSFFDVSKEEINYFYGPFSKHDRVSSTFRYDIALYSNEDYWYDIPPHYLFVLNDYAFDLRWLMHAFQGQLNSSKNNMPYPTYPYNPMTRVPLCEHTMSRLKKIISNYHDLSFIPDIVFYFIQNSHSLRNDCPFSLIELLERKYRFQKLNITDSQENYTGRWVLKSEPMSSFEIQFDAINERNVIRNFQEALEDDQQSLLNLFSTDYLIRRFGGFT